MAIEHTERGVVLMQQERRSSMTILNLRISLREWLIVGTTIWGPIAACGGWVWRLELKAMEQSHRQSRLEERSVETLQQELDLQKTINQAVITLTQTTERLSELVRRIDKLEAERHK